jgi:hypothetical protein
VSNCEVIADKGYISTGQQMSLFEEAKIKVITPPRINMNIVSEWNNSYRYMRKRIETLFSQMCDQFLIKRNYAKTTAGVFTRILAKLSTVSVLQAINKDANRPTNHLKYALKY